MSFNVRGGSRNKSRNKFPDKRNNKNLNNFNGSSYAGIKANDIISNSAQLKKIGDHYLYVPNKNIQKQIEKQIKEQLEIQNQQNSNLLSTATTNFMFVKPVVEKEELFYDKITKRWKLMKRIEVE